MTERIKAGPARSERELSIYATTQVVCPNCKHQGLILNRVEKSPKTPVAQTKCPNCNTRVDVRFTAGPGWGDEPDNPLRLASGDAPSSILPESYFREKIESGVRRVRDRAASDPGAVAAIAADVICNLLEIQKLQRAAGDDLSPADRALLAEISTTFVKASGDAGAPDRSVTALEQGIARTAAILRRHLSHSMPERAWEVELAHMLGVVIPGQSIADTLMLWEAQTATTPFPDGFGPWGAHPVWAEESYGIGHTRTFVRLLSDGGRPVPRGHEVAEWIRAMQTSDGAFACQAEFERLYRQRHPERAARRDEDARAGWKRATGEDAAGAWPHSDLEDAWNALDALVALGSSPRDRDGAIAWLRAHQREDGAFRATPTYDGDGDRYSGPLSDTMYGVRALALLGVEPADADACIEWLLAIPEPPLIIPRWAQLETLAALGALERIDRVAELARWQNVELSIDPDEPRVSFDAYAALRVKALL